MIALILRRLPEAVTLEQKEHGSNAAPTALLHKGFFGRTMSKYKTVILFWWQRLLNFILEAKDLRHSAAVSYKIKKIFQKRSPVSMIITTTPSLNAPINKKITKSESDYLQLIKADPRNLANYNNLGQLYVEQGAFLDARHIFEYLIKHEPGNSTYYAKLGYCMLQLRQYIDAAANYEKALALDSGYPNRYYNLGFAYKASGKLQEAKTALMKALELESENIKYADALKDIERKLSA